MKSDPPWHGGLEVDSLRLLTCGSVDDGKSTLIGRLLYDADLVPDDQRQALHRESARHMEMHGGIDYSLLVDGLEAEREQGITIDVAYRFFATNQRSFIVADAPGHERYTRNMATAASTADLAVLLVDARTGILQQTRRHARICALFGIRYVVLAVNKMDLVRFDQERFRKIEGELFAFARGLDMKAVSAIPVSARNGDNVVHPSTSMPWYAGPTLFDYLTTVTVSDPEMARPFRFPIQQVNRITGDIRAVAGHVASGTVAPGDNVIIFPSQQKTRIQQVLGLATELPRADAGDAIMLTFTDQIDAGRGDVVVQADEAVPHANDQFAAHIVWTGEKPLLPGRSYLLRVGNLETPGTITSLRYQVDVNTGEHVAARQVEQNEIAFCHLATTAIVTFDSYSECRATGSFIIIDRETSDTVGAGMIAHVLRRAENIHPHAGLVDQDSRALLKGQKPTILWFTGFSGAGKSTIANLVEAKLLAKGVHTYLLDGDNIRLGLNRDLGFTAADRVENIRRVGEVARLFVDAGLVVLCAFISPFISERTAVRGLVKQGEFVEIFIDTPLNVCRSRDPKGLYSKAAAGNISNFTGIDSPYEAPKSPEIRIETARLSPKSAADLVVNWLIENERISL